MKRIGLVEEYPVGLLRPHPKNYRRHRRQVIQSSLAMVQHRTIAVRVDDPADPLAGGTVIAGHGVWYVTKDELGRPTIAVSLVECTDEEAEEAVVLDNRSQELGEDDPVALLELLEPIAARGRLDAVGYAQTDVDALLDRANGSNGAGSRELRGDPDDAPGPPVEPTTVEGDVWLLGEHRLLCGDATARADIARLMDGRRACLMVTDPPYGVAYGKGRGGQKKNAIRGDLSQTAIPISFAVALEVALDQDARVYLFGGSGNWSMYARLFDHHLHVEPKPIVWVKESFVLRPNNYHSQFEMVYFGWLGIGGDPRNWYGDRKQADVWQVHRDPDRVHPTQKPVEVVSIPIRNSSPPGGLVFEPFGGSGSTLIAGHQLGRTVYVAELDPVYCDVICRRFEQATGIVPVLERTGEEHSFLDYQEAEPEAAAVVEVVGAHGN